MFELLLKTSSRIYYSVIILILTFCLCSVVLMHYFPFLKDFDNYKFTILVLGVLSAPVVLVSLPTTDMAKILVDEMYPENDDKQKEKEKRDAFIHFWLLMSSFAVFFCMLCSAALLIITDAFELQLFPYPLYKYGVLLFFTISYTFLIIRDTKRRTRLLSKSNQSLESPSDLPSDTPPQPPSHTPA